MEKNVVAQINDLNIQLAEEDLETIAGGRVDIIICSSSCVYA